VRVFNGSYESRCSGNISERFGKYGLKQNFYEDVKTTLRQLRVVHKYVRESRRPTSATQFSCRHVRSQIARQSVSRFLTVLYFPLVEASQISCHFQN
jgi:hypothetical protein